MFVGSLVVIGVCKERVEEAFARKDGILKTSELRELRIDSRGIRRLVESGVMEKIKTGYYRSLAVDPSEASMIARLFPEAILWGDTALFYHGYSDRTPMEWELMVSKNVSSSRFKIDYPYVKPFFVRPKEVSFGVTTMGIDGVRMRILDRDRLICECLKYEADMDRETFNKAIQAYLADPKKNIRHLTDYAERRGVTKRVKDVLGVWL